MAEWIMEKYGPTGGIGGEGVRNLLTASGLPGPEDVLAREAIQNSVDARLDSGKITVRFRRSLLSGDHKVRFLDALRLREDLEPRLELLTGLGDAGEETLARALLSDPEEPLELLYVEDFGTIGLGGGPTDPVAGHFYRLLFLVGDGDKGSAGMATGGSYGYGKSVYASNSALFTIVTYSVFKASVETDGTHARLLGSAFLRRHLHAGTHFTGRGWFGKRGARDDEPRPLEDEEAHALAAELGFSPRAREETGTSILIVGAKLGAGGIDLDRLRRAIETWWWPRILDDAVDVELFDGDARVPGPRPRGRPDLEPYVKCYLAATRNATDDVVLKSFNRVHQIEPGDVAITAIERGDASDSDGSNAEERADLNVPVPNRVALVRGARMVVSYEPLGSERMPAAIGVFVAAPAADSVLKLSEPPAHNKWDPHSHRLARTPPGKDLVEAILNRCKKTVRDFQRQLAPPRPKPKERLKWLDRVLGQALSSAGRSPVTPPTGELGDVRIHFPRLVAVPSNGALRLEADLTLQLKENVAEDVVVVRVRPILYIQEGEHAHKGDHLPAVLSAADSGVVKSRDQEACELELTKGAVTSLSLVSDDYDRDWTVELAVTAEPLQPPGG